MREKKNIHIILTEAEINKRIDQIEALDCDQELRDFLISTLEALLRLDELIGMKNTTIARLRKIFGKKSEKLPKENKQVDSKPKGRKQGQGNNGQNNYPTAPQIKHELDDSKKSGKKCPECGIGTLRPYECGIYIRIHGSPTLKATVHKTEKTRCDTCGAIFEADFDGKDKGKYDYSAYSIIAIMHYLASFPFYRLEKIQKQFLTPMPRSVQWQMMEELANILIFVWKALLAYGKEGELFLSDDTGAKIISAMQSNREKRKNKERVKLQTTGIIAKRDGHEIVMFFTGIKYSGENLDDLLSTRNSEAPIELMSDALNQNNPKSIKNLIHHLCLTHGRRKFEDLEEKFLSEADYVKRLIALVYKNDSYCKENGLTGKKRLLYHQENSTSVMDELKTWCEKCFTEKLVEPNSTLGKGVSYLLNHWEGLTGFLKYEDAPLDNNQLESQLRVPVLNRKNWLFFQTEVGAFVGDIILSILKTCEANGIDNFRYLNHIQEHADEVKKNPEQYLPWNIILS